MTPIERIFQLAGTKAPPAPSRGYVRAWARCSCGRYGFRDFVPYGLANPMIWCLGCGADWRRAKAVTERRAALGILAASIGKRAAGVRQLLRKGAGI